MKQCTICGESKPLEDFSKKASSSDGLGHWCRPCRKAKKREEYQRHREKYLSRSAKQRKENPERVAAIKRQCYLNKRDQYREQGRANYQANREERLQRLKEYRQQNAEKIKARNAGYRDRNRERLNENQKLYYRKNREARLEYHAEWYERHGDRARAYARWYSKKHADKVSRYVRERRATDPLYALAADVRKINHKAFSRTGYSKRSKARELLGCDFETLAQHLEAQFQPGMTWENRGEWHIDHIIPLASAETEEQLLALCHYTNLQPLWAFENLSKGAKLPEEARP